MDSNGFCTILEVDETFIGYLDEIPICVSYLKFATDL